ncbi:hypothetical protein DQ04_08121030 [Trypanosoma grayi]|uniref:hypothetical protein n=1 Tax=Trypanosoma grayi TaxID=71804 RepID=UPI0004F3F9CA|nr:hypothetical protein DQ04_08121030 [Trypanosoma grayi]KEG08056.1 hypothetical protein DQ04_08121030 [Trypanosoma grayi]
MQLPTMRRKTFRRRYGAAPLLLPLLILLVLLAVWCIHLIVPKGISPAETVANEELNNVDVEEQVHEEKPPQLVTDDSFAVLARRILDGSRHIGEDMDIQLFAIWHGAYPRRKAVLQDIHKNFVILDLAEFDWGGTPTEFGKQLTNLWILYSGKGGWDKVGMEKKLLQCGFGRFTAVVVADLKPHYRTKMTAHGKDIVNVLMHKKKNMYRSWTGGGFKVHGTFSTQEANHDIRLLFHRTLEGVLKNALETRAYARDLVSVYLSNAKPFFTIREVYGSAYDEGEQWAWSCDDFIFALGSLTKVRVSDAETKVVLWLQSSSPPGKPYVVEILKLTTCIAWPESLLLEVPPSEMWGAIALLNATPIKEGFAQLDSDFSVALEGATRVLQVRPYA